jgi:hypothetical protein
MDERGLVFSNLIQTELQLDSHFIFHFYFIFFLFFLLFDPGPICT